MKQKRTRYIDGDIEEIIRDKAIDGWGPAQIFRFLSSFLKDEGKNRYPPNVRTIQRIVNSLEIKDISIWSIADSAAEDSWLVLDVLAERLARGITKFFTKTEADWIVKVRKAAPDAPNNVVFLLAFSYTVKEEAGYDSRAMDAYLALTPWKDKVHLRQYKRLVAQKTIPHVPGWPVLVDELFGPLSEDFKDPRFTGSAVDIREFENNICELSNRGESLDSIADMYNIHPDDINDIVKKYEKGGTQ